MASGATEDELKLFLYTAIRTGLDPLTRQLHFVKRGGQATIQTGIDGYRAIAESKGDLAGIEDAVFDTETEPHPGKATVTVYRLVDGQRVPFTASARWTEYAPAGTQSFMWNKMPYLMLAKCAEALALRKAFPSDLTGIYTDEEMDQAGGAGRLVRPAGPSALRTAAAEAASENAPAEEASSKEEGTEMETDELECYCTLCGAQGVKGKRGYYCPNYRDKNHKQGGQRRWELVGKEEKRRREQEAQQLLKQLDAAERKAKKEAGKQAPF